MNPDLFRLDRQARKMHLRTVMKTVAALSLFSLAPAVVLSLAPATARAQQLTPAPRQEKVAMANPPQPDEPYPPPSPYQAPIPPPNPYQPPANPDQSGDPNQPIDSAQLPELYQPPGQDPYEAGADPAQVDWPQDVVPEEATADSYDDGYDPRAYGEFQDDLSPYGDWVDDSTYGRVWMPEPSLVGADFTPYYTGGHWLLTEYGWTWVSDWSWGWAPFHYGRWIVGASNRWCWVPGRIWGPAWVSWRSGGGWVGWAALPPRGVSVTTTYGHRSPWRFSRLADLGAPRPRCVPMREMPGLFHRTTLVANDRVLTRGAATVHINAGPRYVPNATPTRLMVVAPQAFPQRAILPRDGASMSQRPWMRAASSAPASADRGVSVPANRGPVIRAGASRRFGGHDSAGRMASPPPRTFSPPRTFATTSPARTFGSTPPANPQPARYAPAPGQGAPHTYGGAPIASTPHTYGPAAPRIYGAPPASNLPRVYSPPPRTFAQPPMQQRPPVQTFHQAYTPAPTHTAPPQPHNFGTPSFGGGGGFGHPGGGGGMHFGGGGMRRR